MTFIILKVILKQIKMRNGDIMKIQYFSNSKFWEKIKKVSKKLKKWFQNFKIYGIMTYTF